MVAPQFTNLNAIVRDSAPKTVVFKAAAFSLPWFFTVTLNCLPGLRSFSMG